MTHYLAVVVTIFVQFTKLCLRCVDTNNNAKLKTVLVDMMVYPIYTTYTEGLKYSININSIS